MFCAKCGTKIPTDANFCTQCGWKTTPSKDIAENTKIIAKARVTLVFAGYGDLTLTNVSLIWNKSASSYLTFGALNALSENHLMIPITNIATIGTYTYFPGGGLVITQKDGKVYKIAFKKKKDFSVVYDYLSSHLIR